MSKENNLQTFDTYNINDIIKDISVSTAYIQGLQRILTDMLLNFSAGTEKIPEMFKKFELAISDNPENKVDVTLNREESDIYTLFSLLQLFKYNANEQGLAKKTETTATVDELKELAMMMHRQEDVTEKLKEIQEKMTVIN
jgi:hypothetical protein